MNTDDRRYDCLLTLSCPAELEEEFIDLLREQPQWVSGFTTLSAEGFGAGTSLHTTIEQVRGRSRRRLLQILMRGPDVPALLEVLASRVPSNEVAWWTMPVEGFGRFA